MPVIHVVLLKFQDGVDSETVSKVGLGLDAQLHTCALADKPQFWKQLLDLQHDCIHPETKKPYVKSYNGGTNISQEGFDVG